VRGAAPAVLGVVGGGDAGGAGDRAGAVHACRARDGAAYAVARAGGEAAVYRAAPGAAGARAAWRAIGELAPAGVVRGVVGVRCGGSAAVVVYVHATARDPSAEREYLAATRCASECAAPVVLGERVVPDPEVAASDAAVLVVHAGDLFRGEALTGRFAGFDREGGAPYWRIALENDPTRGVAAGVVDDHAVVFLASGRDEAAEVYHAEPGATSFEAGEAVIEP
jgi:hypothetical protein